MKFFREVATKLLLAAFFLLPSCQGFFGTIGGERVCLKLDTVTARPTENIARQITKRLAKRLQFEEKSYAPMVHHSSWDGSETLLSNSEGYPGWNLFITYDPEYFNFACLVTTPEWSDSRNVALARRVTEELQAMFPNSTPSNCTAYRDFLGP